MAAEQRVRWNALCRECPARRLAHSSNEEIAMEALRAHVALNPERPHELVLERIETTTISVRLLCR